MSKERAFIDKIAPIVSKYESEFFHAVTIAQACLESGYGTSKLATEANNIFGIKASYPWRGKTYNVLTGEEAEDGSRYQTKADFRAYDSWEESIKDHASFMVSTEQRKSTYAVAINASSPKEQAKALSKTYATDSNYGEELIKIMDRYNLYQYAVNKRGAEKVEVKPPLKIVREILPPTKTFGYIGKPWTITLHQTGAPGVGQNARAMANYQRNMSNPANREQKSWHYQVDDHEAIQSFEHGYGCWHASDGRGNGNMHTVAIESCINADGNYAKTIDNTCKLMAWICFKEGFDPRKIKRHYDWAPDKKWCPAQILNGKQGFTFAKVIDMTIKELAILHAQSAGKVSLNPQGLATEELAKYEPPKMPYKEHAVGDTVTLANDFRWYDYSNNKLMLSKRQSELTGTTDKVVEVKKIDPVGTSRIMYRLDKYNSWILEEYLKESYAHWKVISKEEDEAIKEAQPLKDGQFRWNGKVYEIKEIN